VRARRSNGPFAVSLFSDKLLSHALLGPDIALPELLALIERGRLYPFRASTVADVNSLLRYCDGVGSVILKPSQGQKGGGVFRLESRGGVLSLNRSPADRAAVEKLIARLDDYLVEAYETQAPYAMEIFPATANTVRIVTLCDVDSAQPFIAAAIHKFGTEETAPTDNWTRGALSAPIDLQTGRPWAARPETCRARQAASCGAPRILIRVGSSRAAASSLGGGQGACPSPRHHL